MSEYRRAHIPGGAKFFTVKIFERKPVLTNEDYRSLCERQLPKYEGNCLSTVSPGFCFPTISIPFGNYLRAIGDYSLRWSLIKQHVTRKCAAKD